MISPSDDHLKATITQTRLCRIIQQGKEGSRGELKSFCLCWSYSVPPRVLHSAPSSDIVRTRLRTASTSCFASVKRPCRASPTWPVSTAVSIFEKVVLSLLCGSTDGNHFGFKSETCWWICGLKDLAAVFKLCWPKHLNHHSHVFMYLGRPHTHCLCPFMNILNVRIRSHLKTPVSVSASAINPASFFPQGAF